MCICSQVVLGIGSPFHPEKGMMGISLEVARRSHLLVGKGKGLCASKWQKRVFHKCDACFWLLLLDSLSCFLDIILT